MKYEWIKQIFKEIYDEDVKVEKTPTGIRIWTCDFVVSFDRPFDRLEMYIATNGSHTISERDLEVLNALKVLINKILEVK